MCTNDRKDGGVCCQRFATRNFRKYMKNKCKELDIHNLGQIRINSGGCMGRCNEGPVIVIYPEAVWYTFVDEEDLDEIIESHLIKGKVVQRLLLAN
jgi:(2Fe-2S) ferredoxin